MKTFKVTNSNLKPIRQLLNGGKIGVIPTDTIYGISCNAFDKNAIEKIYEIKQRERQKPFIILIPNVKSLDQFGITVSGKIQNFFQEIWPNKVTVILDVSNEKLEYLHRGIRSLGFRIPEHTWLRSLLELTGPITSTSVNQSGEKSIETIAEAQQLLGNKVNFYVDEGTLSSEASTVIKIDANEKLEVLRAGAIKADFWAIWNK